MQLTLIDTRIRQEAHGRYCLNDLHRAAVAAGANARAKEPGKFFRSPRTQELLVLLEQEAAANLSGGPTPIWGSTSGPATTPNWGSLSAPVVTIEGREGGTDVCIELVIAYGQFVSAAFDLKVIRTFLATKFWDLLRPHWAGIAQRALAGLKNKAIAAQVGRSSASVGRCLRRQYEVGYCNPVDVFKARLAPATAARWAIAKPVAAQWGRPVQSAAQGVLNFEEVQA